MKIFAVLICTALVAWMAWGNQAHAQQLYKWTDKKGVVHLTDNPDELPEPMRTKALKDYKPKERKQQTPKTHGAARRGPRTHGLQSQDPVDLPHERIPPGPTDSGGPLDSKTQTEAPTGGSRSDSKAAWGAKMSAARKLVADLEARCKNARSEHDRSSRAKLTLGRPMDRAQAGNSEKALAECLKKLEAAKRSLNVDLPEEARRKGVPPGWLR
jgi:hypothetical protein